MTDLPLPPLPDELAEKLRFLFLSTGLDEKEMAMILEVVEGFALAYGRMVAERCAEICESWADGAASKSDVSTEVLRLAAAIRANKEAT